MSVRPEDSPPCCQPDTLARWRIGLRVLCTSAALLLLVGLGLQWLRRVNTDLPYDPQAPAVWQAVVASLGPLPPEGMPDAAFTQAWTRWLITLNGQYDARVLAVGALVLFAIGTGLGFVALASRLRAEGALTLASLAGLMLAACRASGLHPDPQSAGTVLMIGLGAAQIACMGGNAPGRRALWVGAALGLAGIVVDPSGSLATAVVTLWHGLMGVRDRTTWPARRGAFFVGLGLLGLGLARCTQDTARGVSTISLPEDLPSTLGWPIGSVLWAPILWAPVIFCLARTLTGDTRRAAMAPFGLFALALAAAGAARPEAPAPAGAAIGFFALVVNSATVILWWSTSRRSAEGRLVMAFVWLATAFLGLMHGSSSRMTARVGPALHDTVTADLRRAVTSAADDAAGTWRDPRVRAILPPSIRAPLGTVDSPPTPWSQGAPAPLTSPGYPVFGSWSETGATTSGEFVSEAMTSRLPMVELWFCGTLEPPGTVVRLRTTDGREMAPLTARAASPDRWKRLIFEAPPEAFRLVVRDTDPAAWIAVTAPVELGRGSWLARKLTSMAPWVVWAGVLCAAAAAGCAIPLAIRAHRDWLERGAPSFPWHFIPRLAVVGLLIYFALNLDTTAGPNDSGGYLNSAKLLAHGRVAMEPRTQIAPGLPELDPTMVLPGTFRVAPDGRLAPEYPVGFPLIVATIAQALPLERAVAASMLMHLLMAILGTRALARIAGMPEGWAWLAAALVGLCPVFWFEGLQPVSDVPALAWVVLAFCCAWRSRERPCYAIAAGVATAIAVMIRPSNVLCAAPILVSLSGRWRQLLWWVLAGLPGAVWLGWYQQTLYGSPFATGYGDISSGFGLRFLEPTLRSYARWLPEFFTPLIVLAVAGPFVTGVAGRLRAALAVWAAVFLCFYAVYWCTWDTWFNMRFILPAAPAMVVLALIALRRLSERLRLEPFTTRSFTRGIIPTVLLWSVVVATLAGSGFSRRVLFWVHCNHEHAVAAQWARDHLPADAVVFAKHASGPLTYYTDLAMLRRDHPQAQSAEFLDAIERAGRPVFAVTYHWETQGFEYRGGELGSGYPELPGPWRRLAALWDDHVFVWARDSETSPPGAAPPTGQ